MPQLRIAQRSIFSPAFADPSCLVVGELPWILSRFASMLFPSWIFDGWAGEGRRGRRAWPVRSLAAMLLLRWEDEGMSRRACARRAQHDTRWLAAMDLQIGAATPDERTVRRFEAFLRGRHPELHLPRYLLLHEHLVRLCVENGVVAKPTWATDSTPMWAYGAVLDTIELLGDGVRGLAKRWAKLTNTPVATVAERWEAPWVLAKSTKGAFRVDWSDDDARANVVDTLAHGALRVVEFIRGNITDVASGHRKGLLHRCAHVLRAVESDLETDAKGRLTIAERVARDRLISLTDPKARHGRKSKSATFDGFKLHLVGDVVSGVIASVAVTSGNVHDNVPAHRLFARAKKLYGEIECILGDTAYGSAELRHRVREKLGLQIIAPPPPVSVQDGRLSRKDFDVDFDNNVVTCPAGKPASTTYTTWSSDAGTHLPVFKWSNEVCSQCPMRAQCRGKQTGGHRLLLHPFEKELREARDAWAEPATREAYRTRTQTERLVNQLVRHGARTARAWGLRAAHMQAHLIAGRCNLSLLARRLAAPVEQQRAA